MKSIVLSLTCGKSLTVSASCGMVGYYDLILIFRVLSYLKYPIRYNRLILSSFNRG